MIASLLQIAGLVAVVVGLGIVAGIGGVLIGGGASVLFVGVAADQRRVG